MDRIEVNLTSAQNVSVSEHEVGCAETLTVELWDGRTVPLRGARVCTAGRLPCAATGG